MGSNPTPRTMYGKNPSGVWAGDGGPVRRSTLVLGRFSAVCALPCCVSEARICSYALLADCVDSFNRDLKVVGLPGFNGDQLESRSLKVGLQFFFGEVNEI